MNRTLATMVLAATTFTGAALHAATPNTYTVANPSHEKTVHLQLRNSTSAPMQVKAGDTEMTLAPGKLVAVKLPVGTQIVAVTDSAHYPQGTVLATISTSLADATITLQ